MSSRLRWTLAAAIVALGVLPWAVATQTAGDGSQFGHTDWPFIGGDWTNSRYSTLDQINRSTVATLGAAWSLPFDGGASTRATPVVKDGVLFIGSGTRLYARDAATGAEIWTVQPDQDASSDLERAGIGDILNAVRGIPSPPGVALGDGKVFVGLMDGRVAAFSQATGRFEWSTQIGYDPPRKGQAVSGAPIYVDGKVFTGLANGDWAFRGKVVALDANTGDVLWDFWTIPGPGEPGSETWPQEGQYGDVWKQGGAGVWHVANADPELGLVYYVTGNAVPMFGGEARSGDNLYTASVLAFDMESGDLRWHYQVVRHDLWDADIAIAPLLYDTVVDGRAVKGLAALRADGFLFMLDRETGEPVFPIEEPRFRRILTTTPPPRSRFRSAPRAWCPTATTGATGSRRPGSSSAAALPRRTPTVTTSSPRGCLFQGSVSPPCRSVPTPASSMPRDGATSDGRVGSPTTRGSVVGHGRTPSCPARSGLSPPSTPARTGSRGSTRSCRRSWAPAARSRPPAG